MSYSGMELLDHVVTGLAMPIGDASHRFEHGALAVLEPRQRIRDSVAARVLGGDVRIVRRLVAEALDQHEHARVGGISVDVERQYSRLLASGGNQPFECGLDGRHLTLAGHPTSDDKHCWDCTVRRESGSTRIWARSASERLNVHHQPL